MVQLKEQIGTVIILPEKFQFQYGTIKSYRTMKRKFEELNFNSNMVQLKDCNGRKNYKKRKAFQFQYGTIKRKLRTSKASSNTKFQFQYGTIKRKRG